VAISVNEVPLPLAPSIVPMGSSGSSARDSVNFESDEYAPNETGEIKRRTAALTSRQGHGQEAAVDPSSVLAAIPVASGTDPFDPDLFEREKLRQSAIVSRLIYQSHQRSVSRFVLVVLPAAMSLARFVVTAFLRYNQTTCRKYVRNVRPVSILRKVMSSAVEQNLSAVTCCWAVCCVAA
jgi:hypothetical protein